MPSPLSLAKMLSGANVFETLKPVAFKKMKLKFPSIIEVSINNAMLL